MQGNFSVDPFERRLPQTTNQKCALDAVDALVLGRAMTSAVRCKINFLFVGASSETKSTEHGHRKIPFQICGQEGRLHANQFSCSVSEWT